MRWTTIVLAAALAVGAAPMTAGATRAGGTQAQRRAAWTAERTRLAHGLPHTGTYDEVEDAGGYAELQDAGDLDGDGKGDVLDVRGRRTYDDVAGYVENVRLEAFRGRDGKALWSVTLPPASFVYAVAVPVGVDGKPGVLVTAYDMADYWGEVSYTSAYAVTVTSFDHAGTPLWSRALSGGWLSSIFGGGHADNDVVGLINGVAGGGDDLLVQAAVGGGGSDPLGTVDEGRSVTQYGILDGATGAVRPIGQPIPSRYAPSAVPVGDFDKDRLDDVVVDTDTDAGPSLTALSSGLGSVLWTATGYAPDGYRDVVELPDVTGDGAADVGVVATAFGGGFATQLVVSPSPATSSSTAMLVDGARGSVLWRKAGSRLMPLGNADRKGGADVAVGEPITGANAGFTVAAYTSSGKRLWGVTRKLPFDGDKRSYTNSWSAFADFDGDGVKDIGYAVVTGTGAKERRDEGSVDGRTGRVTRDPRPGMFGTRAALDGRGADAYVVESAGGILTLTAWRGDAPQRLWSTGIRLAGEEDHTFATSVDGDRCGDLALAALRGETYTDVVYSGSTGTPLWALTRTGGGDAAGVVSKPAVTRHTVYRRSC